ncbi:STAS/SEC14 domain-containing protein [Tunicatimonas pelagia]|uniref:STAS/SEC14 domain-containing protein n=1 Tax=Tunicatimonas pelagia TaxID=931531 RepID=UPI0026657DD3|nr:STAS/SEC14 domain-containing protein [Tunicatimonas pelagia]WKN45131.1 STAS/SEC14 domain-containing protein [Tunicatimonas pelagia]
MEATAISVKNGLGNDFLHIEYNEASKWVYARWVGDVTNEDVKHGAEKILEQLQQHHCPHILNDNRELVGSWDEVTEWVQQDWMPRAIGAGLQKFAHIISPDIFAAMSVEEMVTRASGFEMRIFEDEAEAKAWLESE